MSRERERGRKTKALKHVQETSFSIKTKKRERMEEEEERKKKLTSRVETAHRIAQRPGGGMALHDGLRQTNKELSHKHTHKEKKQE